MVAGGVFGVMCLIIISLVILLLVQIYKRYDSILLWVRCVYVTHCSQLLFI